MFNVTTAPARFAQRLTEIRARRQSLDADRAVARPTRTSLGETLAIGLGCDRYPSYRP